MRIAHLVDNLAIGGAQKLILTFAKGLERRSSIGLEEHSLTVISLGFNYGSSLPDQFNELGANVRSFITKRIFSPQQILQLYNLFRFERFDVVQTHLSRANILGSIVGRITKIPIICTLHSTQVEPRYQNPNRDHLETFVFRYLAHKVIAVGYSVAEIHQKRMAPKVLDLILNPVDFVPEIPATDVNIIRKEIMRNAGRPMLIAVGRLSPPKGYRDLISAFAIAQKEVPDAYLVIVGGGSLYEDLQTQISELGLSKHAILLGSRGDVPRLLNAADIFVSSSHWEGLPLAILEAMSAGLPIIATEVGDIPHILKPEFGIVVPPFQPQSIANAMISLLSNQEKLQSCGQKARDYVMQAHDPDAWVNKMLDFYMKVVEE